MIWISLAAVGLLAAIVVATVKTRRKERPPRRTSSVKRLLASVAGVMAGIVIAVSGAGATYAYLNAQTAVGGATLKAGTLGLTIVTPPSAANFQNLLPGESARQTVTVTSTGDAPAKVSARLSASTPMLVRLAAGACSGPISTPALTVASSTLADFVKGQTQSFCLQVTAPTSGLAPTTTYPVGVTLDSVQKAN